MEQDFTSYQKLAVKQYATRSLRQTAEGRFWQQFAHPEVIKQVAGITNIDFCPQQPHDFAVTSSTRVLLYNGITRKLQRTIGRFKDKAYSGCYRQDGKVLVAGGEDGVVQVFDTNSRLVLRQLQGHRKPTHVARFAPDKLHVLSASDDVTVRWWDVSEGAEVQRFEGHSDYIRAAACSPTADRSWATGGYDHICKIWDVRAAGQSQMSMDHGAPIEDVAFFHTGALLATVGGTSLCIWDVLGGGRLLKRLSNFQKTVTCLKISPCAGTSAWAAPRLLAGSLDGHVKIFELDSFKVTHASRYPAPILSLGLSQDCRYMAVGMADGNLSIRKHKKATNDHKKAMVAKRQRSAPSLSAANYRYFLRGRNARGALDDFKFAKRKRAKLAAYDKFLKKFRYREALDAALSTRSAATVDSVIEELAARGGLSRALSNRDEESLLPLLQYLCRYIIDPRHSKLLTALTHRVLDVYAPVVGLSTSVDKELFKLKERLTEEMQLHSNLAQMQGALDMILTASLSAAASP